jgi:hypothetical protein
VIFTFGQDEAQQTRYGCNILRENTLITIVFHLFGPFCAVLASKFAKSDNKRQKFNMNSMLISNLLKQLQKSSPQKSYRRNKIPQQ